MSKVYVVTATRDEAAMVIISVYQDEGKAINRVLGIRNWYQNTTASISTKYEVQPYDVDIEDHPEPVAYIVRDSYNIVGVFGTKEDAERTNGLLRQRSQVDVWGIVQ